MDTLSAPEIPLCVNVLRLLSYRLAPDELLMFDWLVVKQIAFGYKPFHYSLMRVEEETRIHRNRQDAIIKKFSDWGFLATEVKINAARSGRVRYFEVNFKMLSDPDVLFEIILPSTTLFQDFLRYFEYHAKLQKKGKMDKLAPMLKSDHAIADRIYGLLNATYEERRILFNEGKVTGQVPSRMKSQTQLQRNKPIDRKLIKLSQHYNDQAIKNAFTAYVDELLRGVKTPDNLMFYFLSFDEVLKAFAVADYYLNNFTLNYTYPSKE